MHYIQCTCMGMGIEELSIICTIYSVHVWAWALIEELSIMCTIYSVHVWAWALRSSP